MSTTLQDVLNTLEDYSGQYDTGVVNQSIKIRHINRAIEWVKRKVGLPADERQQTIRFSQDKLFYNLNSDVDELLYLWWDEQNMNTVGRTWEQARYEEILKLQGEGTRKYKFAQTHINGSNQAVIWGYNKIGQTTIDEFDLVGDWEVAGDASSLTRDDSRKFQGGASLSFDITNSTGLASITNDDINLPIKDLIDKNGSIKLYTWMSDNDIDDVTLYLYETSSKYYTITVTTDDDGTAFAEDAWIKLGFDLEDRVEVGSPDKDNNITQIKTEFDLGSGFTSATDFGVDYMYQVFPDDLDLVYKSKIKGTDTTGTTNKNTLDTVTDIVALGDNDDLATIIGLRAAYTLWPALRGDANWYMLYNKEIKETLGDFARRNPRRRTAGSFNTHLRR